MPHSHPLFLKYQDLPHPPGKEIGNGESALYLGRSYRIEIVPEGLYQVQWNNAS